MNPPTPNSEDNNAGAATTTDVAKKTKPGMSKNDVWNFFIEIGQRAQEHCSVRCKECGWEKKSDGWAWSSYWVSMYQNRLKLKKSIWMLYENEEICILTLMIMIMINHQKEDKV